MTDILSDAQAAEDLLGHMTYKVDWWFEIVRPTSPRITAELKITSSPVYNSYNPGSLEQARVEMRNPVPPGFALWPFNKQVYWFRDCVRALELHEMDEWLKIDGEMIYDPHSGKKWEYAGNTN